jgi:hypothetical protein
MTQEQVQRLRELPHLISKEQDTEKVKLLAAELRDLASLELEEIRSKFSQVCMVCGTSIGVHTAEMLESCARKQRDSRN